MALCPFCLLPFTLVLTLRSGSCCALAGIVKDPWICAGDFNAILNAKERKGGLQTRRTGCKMFRVVLEDNCLHDMGLQGSLFAWNWGDLYQRLDRAICNEDWMTFAPDSSIRHLHRLKSDHRPILLSTNSSISSMANRPFRFLANLLIHTEFNSLVRGTWNTTVDVVTNIKGFLESVREWNNKVFGNIFARKRKLIGELRKVQKALKNHNSPRLSSHEVELRTKIEDTL